ncbi:MAG: TolC family protein, partial [Muribaculaceae bacterium]|nr:TolC family protein [Muribaculaceae bacterium]
MNLRLLFIYGIVGTACLSAAGSEPAAIHSDTLSLSLDDCIRVALDNNPTVRIADMDITRVDYSKKETIGALLPTISFGATYNRMLAKQVAYMNMDAFGSPDSDNTDTETSNSKNSGRQGIKMGLDNSYSVGFQASVPLIAPQLWASLKLSDSHILQSVEQARASRLSLINEIKNAYYTLLLAEDSRKVIRQSYEMAALTHDIYTRQHQAGTASDYDVLRTSVAMKNVEPELLHSEIAIKQARLH